MIQKMQDSLFNSKLFRRWLAIFIGAVLCFAALAKIFYPSPLLIIFYTLVGAFELILAGYLIIFSSRWQSWALIFVVFTAWTGYSLYVTIFGLSCPCLGVAIDLPRGIILIIDAVVLALSWGLLAKDSEFLFWKNLLLFSGIAFFIGFFSPLVLSNF